MEKKTREGNGQVKVKQKETFTLVLFGISGVSRLFRDLPSLRRRFFTMKYSEIKRLTSKN